MRTDITQDPAYAVAIKASDERFKNAIAAIKLLSKKEAAAAYRRATARHSADQTLIDCGALDRVLQD